MYVFPLYWNWMYQYLEPSRFAIAIGDKWLIAMRPLSPEIHKQTTG